MADLHVISTGSNTAPYETWAKAAPALATALAAAGAGDRVLVDSAHAETVTTLSQAMAGTVASPNEIISCTHSGASGLDAKAAGASITVSANTGFLLNGSFRVFGLTVIQTAVTSTVVSICRTSGNNQIWDTCAFLLSGGHAATALYTGEDATPRSDLQLRNCQFKFSNAAQRIQVNGRVAFIGGSWQSGGTSPTGIFAMSGGTRGSHLTILGFDATNLGSAVNIIQLSIGGMFEADFNGIKMPASWSGAIVVAGVVLSASRVHAINVSSTDTNYTFREESARGATIQETVIVRTGGASDGTTPTSWKMVSTANCSYQFPLYSPWRQRWNDAIGSAITATVECIHDSVTALNDNQFWLELHYLGTAGFPLVSLVSDMVAVDGTPAAQASSSETWTTTGLTNPNTQKAAVTFTPQEKGLLFWRVAYGKPSGTLYVDPKLTLT